MPMLVNQMPALHHSLRATSLTDLFTDGWTYVQSNHGLYGGLH